MLRRCRTPRSIVFPPIILSKLIYDRLFGRWTVGEAWCACTARAHVCGGSVRASPPVRSYLQMALGTCSLAQRSRKLGNDVSDRVLFSFITMHKGITQPYLGSALLTSFCYAYRYVQRKLAALNRYVYITQAQHLDKTSIKDSCSQIVFRHC